MLKRRNFLLGSAIAALLIVPAGALAAGTTVTVRVEGAKRTLLAPKVVHTHAGSVTKGGAKPGFCPATTAAGALSQATHGHWQGQVYSSGPAAGIFVTSIFGEKPPNVNYYWTVFVDNRTASHGICGLKLHRGEQVLFAVTNGTQLPIVVQAPQRANLGRPFQLKVLYYRPTTKHPMGVRTPVAGARVGGQITNKQGLVTLTEQHVGRFSFIATRKGYIRSAPVTVPVS